VRLDACAQLAEADSRAYLDWAPPLEDAVAGAAVTTTVGEHSDPLRHEVARRLEERAGARIVVLPGCGHLAQLDAPAAFAAVISEVAGRCSPVPVAASTEHPTT
jgi:pimeloyl-ACP methyl ester carboxylesterase